MNFLLTSKHFAQLKNVLLSIASVLVIASNTLAANAAAPNTAEEHSSAPHCEQENHGEKTVQLSDTQLKNAGVSLSQVAPASIRETLALYGNLQVNGEKTQQVTPRFAGTVRSLTKKVGDKVHEGEVLGIIESNESLKTYPITAAINGTVAQRTINLGEQTQEKPVFYIVDLTSLWVDIAVFPRDLDKIHVGQTVVINHPANAITTEGQIVALSPLGAAANQALNARVVINNTDQAWLPGLFVNTEVILATRPVDLVVKNSALHEHEGQTVIFVKEPTGFIPRPVKLGRQDKNHSEVLSGVTAGEIYASENSFIIKAELGKEGAEHE